MADSPGDSGGTGLESGASVTTADAPTRPATDQSSEPVDSSDAQEGGETRPPGRPLDSSDGRKTDAPPPAKPISPDLGRKSDPKPQSVSEASTHPQDWDEGEAIELQADQTPDAVATPAESTPDTKPEVGAARAGVTEALDAGEHQREARDAVDAAYAQAEADGLPPNTIERFEADAEQAIDDAPSTTGATEVEFQEPGPPKEVEFQPREPVEGTEPGQSQQPVEASSRDESIDRADDHDSSPAPDDGTHQQQGIEIVADESTADSGHPDLPDEQIVAPGDGPGIGSPHDPADRGSVPNVGSSASELHRTVDLSPSELSALQDYTAMAYEPVNSALWRGSIDDVAKIADLSHDLSAGLQKLPAYEGQVVRGSQPGRPVEAYDLSRYEPGDTVIENGYISATTNPDGLLDGFDGPVAWVIESRTGRDVSSVSSVSSESEVLFDRFTSFTVLSKEFDPTSGPDGTWVIYMEEGPRP